MAESALDLRGKPKSAAYAEIQSVSRDVLHGVTDQVAAMATIASLVHHAFGFLWTGFYRVAIPDQLLIIGPYQGTLGCMDIAFGKGVCGTAAQDRRTVIVPDVHAFPGHIVCDARSRSEIVLPVFDRADRLIAVFDVDASEPGAFDEADSAGLGNLLTWFKTSGA